MKIEYDRTTDSMYIQFSEKPVHRTQSVNDIVMVDLNADGHPVQIEILSASHYGDVTEITYKLLAEIVADQS